MQKNKALFLDRDGVINIEKNYVHKISDFEFTPGIFSIIKEFQVKGFLIFVITNQAGIARGYYTETDVIILHKWMVGQFRQNGITITDIYFCPHHPDFTGSCGCRKPKPGMLLKAIAEYNIDPARSVLIGDKESDIMAGKNAHIGRNIYIHDLLA